MHVLASNGKELALYCIDPSSVVDDSMSDLSEMAYRVIKLPSNIR